MSVRANAGCKLFLLALTSPVVGAMEIDTKIWKERRRKIVKIEAVGGTKGGGEDDLGLL